MTKPTPKTMVCCACKKEQSSENFWNDKGSPNGKVARCKGCHQNKRTLHPHLSHPGSRKAVPLEVVNAEIDIDFLADFKRSGKSGWQLPQAKLLLMKFKEAQAAGVIDFTKVYQAYGAGRAPSSCKNLIDEIRKLAIHNRDLESKGKNKITFDEYWKAGRAFKFGNQVVAEAKSGKSNKKK